jgi:hypothetical protein
MRPRTPTSDRSLGVTRYCCGWTLTSMLLESLMRATLWASSRIQMSPAVGCRRPVTLIRSSARAALARFEGTSTNSLTPSSGDPRTSTASSGLATPLASRIWMSAEDRSCRVIVGPMGSQSRNLPAQGQKSLHNCCAGPREHQHRSAQTRRPSGLMTQP